MTKLYELEIILVFVIMVCGMDQLSRSGITNLHRLSRSDITYFDWFPCFSIIIGSIATFLHNHWMEYHIIVCMSYGSCSMRGEMIDMNRKG